MRAHLTIAFSCAALSTSCVPLAVQPGKFEISDGLRTNIVRAPQRVPTAALPPSQRVEQRSGTNDLRAAAGVHLASILNPAETHVDAGVGYVFTDIGLGDRKIHGLYAEAGPIPWHNDWLRILFQARGEALFSDRNDYASGFALFGRVAAETFTFANGGEWVSKDAVGNAYGTPGLGIFADAGEQKLPGGERATVIAGGIYLRTPAMLMLACCVLPK
jgi:hypothetical protein